MSKLLSILNGGDKSVLGNYNLKFSCDKETKEALEFLKKNYSNEHFEAAIRAIFEESDLKKVCRELKKNMERQKEQSDGQ